MEEDPRAGRTVETRDAGSSPWPCPPRKAVVEQSAALGGGRERGSWWKDVADAKRRKRVAGYNRYRMEDKFKASLKSGLRWLKSRCSRIVGLR
ncbi:hypothetical protein BT93_H3282 [Corymbia citriodora subsp. variegata]|nr:hypothetical protein BT93_H3282 [Corymbia citriodora subsp. variegata]